MRRIAMLAVAGVCLGALVARTSAAQKSEKRPLALDDLNLLREVTEPQISPDGGWVAYTVRSDDLKTDKQTSDVWMTSWDGARTVRLTNTPQNEHQPRWSRDGQYISFLSDRGSEHEIEQLWLLNRSGGEAEKITDFKGGVVDYDWSPDSKRLVLLVEDPDPEQADEKTKDKKTPKPIVIDRFQFKEDKVGYLTKRRQHLYLFDLASRKAECLTPGEFYEWLPSWSPDGLTIAFVSKRGADFDKHDNYDIYVIDAKPGATPRRLTTFEGADGRPAYESRPSWSPDGKSIAYMQGGPSKLIYYTVHQLAVIAVAGGTPRLLTTSLDRNITKPHWSIDGRSIYFLLEDDRNLHLARIPAGGGKIERPHAGRRETTNFDLGPEGKVALAESTVERPAEVFALEGSNVRNLSRQNNELIDRVKLSDVEEISFTSFDGTAIHGFVVKPPGFRADQKYPAILRIHGGPVSQFSNEFAFGWQLLAAHGYVVVAANPRGSSGRGEAFSKAIYADWGNLDRQDVLAAIDYLVAQGVADPTRLGIEGWSYGGMLTNYTIAQDQRFKAAVSGAGTSNILAGYGTDMYVREYEAELGTPWANPDAWIRVSVPFLHADQIKTPTLFMCGEKDFNVPLLNSEQMYQALRSLGVDTQLVIYPGQFHELTRPSYLRDRLQRQLDWFGKHLGASGKPNSAQRPTGR